jgi:hypothetical protein
MHNDEGHFIGIPHNMWNFVTEEVRAFHERLGGPSNALMFGGSSILEAPHCAPLHS